jgi:hypothetical protein
MSGHHFVLTIVIIITLYLVSLLLVKTNHLSLAIQRRFWNSLLLLSFLGTGFSGLTMAYFLDTNSFFPGFFSLLWFHIEFGIIMATIAIFHALWHLYYFRSNFFSTRS